jgi:hypothetical protein
MNSTTISNTTSKKSKAENYNQSEGENSTVNKLNKSSISDNAMAQTKISNQDRVNVTEEKKQTGAVISSNSNTGGVSASKNVNKTNMVPKKPKKRRVQFSRNYLDVVYVESYKKYNIDVSMNGQDQGDIIRCRCLIF